MKMKTVLFVTVVSLAAGWPVHAWKLDTHYWLANEILKELEATNGSVNIPNKKSYPVPAALYGAIKRNKAEYRIGALGPDTYPDMVAGQMTTHPGLESTPTDPRDIRPPAKNLLRIVGRELKDPLQGTDNWPGLWGTDDWLRWVRMRALGPPLVGVSPNNRDREIAFAYGYLAHAAMDMWAHSYVNLYSGDVFSLTDEQEVEFRHMAIETLVKRTHQSILNAPSSMSQEEAAREMQKGIGLPSPNLDKLPSKGLVKPVIDELTTAKAPVEFVRKTLVLNPTVANQYARETTTLHLFAMYTYWAEVVELRVRLQDMINRALEDANKRVSQAEIAFKAADGAVKAAAAVLASAPKLYTDALNAVTAAQNALAAAIEETRQRFNLGSNTNNWPPPARAAIAAYEEALRNATNEFEKAKKNKEKWDDLLAKQAQALQTWNTEKAVRETIKQVRDQSLNPIIGLVNTWQEGIEDAVDAYIRAWEDTSKELMRPHGTRFSPGGDVTEPLKQWVICWGPTFGLPVLGQIAPVCQKALTASSAVSRNLKTLLQNALIHESIRKLIEDIDRNVASVFQEVVPNMAQMVSNTIRIDNGAIAGYARSIINLRSQEPTLNQIDADFANDTSQKRLIIFSQSPQSPSTLTKLLYQDMGLQPPANPQAPPTGKKLSDLSGFAALQNSFTMAKLALLDGRELNNLTLRVLPQSARETPTPMGPYSILAPAGEILIGAIRSIDGDHQWQKIAPRLPTLNPQFDCSRFVFESSDQNAFKYCTARRFGYYPGDPGKGGLKFWQDPELRQTVFNRIFKGPLTPGLVWFMDHEEVALARGVGLCPADPFPPTNGCDACRQSNPTICSGLAVPPQPLIPVPKGPALPPTGVQKPILR
jgi:hypothetical protein